MRRRRPRPPGRPTHLSPDPSLAQPIEILDPILEKNGKAMTLEGDLVLLGLGRADVPAWRQREASGLDVSRVARLHNPGSST